MESLVRALSDRDKARDEAEKYKQQLEQLQLDYQKLQTIHAAEHKELIEGRKRWAYYETRFVECSSCEPETRGKCLMFTEGFCEGERCKVLLDLDSLLDKAIDKGGVK